MRTPLLLFQQVERQDLGFADERRELRLRRVVHVGLEAVQGREALLQELPGGTGVGLALGVEAQQLGREVAPPTDALDVQGGTRLVA
ncbi:hypothetical protein D3C86_2145080 [compost metagenome]